VKTDIFEKQTSCFEGVVKVMYFDQADLLDSTYLVDDGLG